MDPKQGQGHDPQKSANQPGDKQAQHTSDPRHGQHAPGQGQDPNRGQDPRYNKPSQQSEQQRSQK